MDEWRTIRFSEQGLPTESTQEHKPRKNNKQFINVLWPKLVLWQNQFQLIKSQAISNYILVKTCN